MRAQFFLYGVKILMKNHQFKKLAIATAVASALGASFVAEATTVTGTAQQVAANLFKNTTQRVKNNAVVSITAGASEVYLGRTTGFNIVVTLTGAKFATGAPAGPALAATAAVAPAYLGTALLNSAAASAGTDAWSISIAGGGGAGASSVTYSVQPGTDTVGIVQGTLLNFAASALVLDNVTALNAAGGKVSMTVTINDPVGGNQLGGTASYDLISSADGFTFTAPTGTTTERIDVATNNAHGSKTYFSLAGTIGQLDSAYFNAGKFTLTPRTTANCFGVVSGTANCSDDTALAGNFRFASADTISVNVVGTDLGAFRTTAAPGLVIVTGGDNCSGGLVVGQVTGATTGSSATSMTVTFTTTALEVTGGGNSANVCLGTTVTNTTSITAQSLALTVTYTPSSTSVSAPASAMTGTLFPLAYNGTVREVYFFNPASNATQTSMLRVTNPGTTSGVVTISGRKDDGTAGTGNVTFTLPANQGVTLNATELETGTAAAGNPALTGSLGAGTSGKKWHLTVTGEFANMAVQSVTRDANGSLSNMSGIVDGPTAQNAN